MAKIRRATESDLYDYAFLVKQFVREANYPFKMDVELLVGNMKNTLQHPKFLWLVAEKDEELVGFLAGCANSPLFSRDETAVELGWYLQPEHRDGRTAFKLMAEFEAWAKKAGCRHVTMVDIDTLQDLREIYTRKGYTLTEKSYVKEL